ncbi:MAG TPA: GNAT family N-acetyltransferase [Povalibacter sp.]|uniref:GNAT family N-acetyltransferase n=1 Tax=Povalibacter sp. TaxID=1962978 RepID=UPI002C7A4166|nr:GNAT family N-acetyltransferase [Povalibacter sp.]HMN44041.1 GNAT family N-acetyltransferase [Povalibacter sp.]
MATVEIVPATTAQRAALENLMQLYIHDFSEHWAGRSEGELREDGRFAPYPLDAYWSEPAHVPLLIRRGGSLIGFALLNANSHTGQPVDRNVAEFFIARKYRRTGVGTEAAHAVFARYPGQWETAVARRNLAALAFWRKTIAACPQVFDLGEHDINDAHWNGPVIRFQTRS